MATPRKKLQILIYPKIFNVLSFYSKGHYSMHISVVQQTQDGKQHYAIPIILNFTQNAYKSKPPYIHTEKQKKQVYFVTEQFYITYNEQTVILHTMAYFKLEIDPSIPIKSTYINFKLVYNKYSTNLKSSISSKLSSSQSSKPIQIDLDRRKIYINNLMDLDQYKKIVFDECQNFSHAYVYIGSCYLGTRFRLNKYHFMQYYLMQQSEQLKYKSICENKFNKLSPIDKYSILEKQNNLKDFRKKLTQLHSTYVNLKGKMISLIKIFQQNNINSPNHNLIPEIKKILHYQINISTGTKTQQELHRYYQTQTLQQIYLQIYKQMIQFDLYITYLWKKYIQLIYNITINIFQSLIKYQDNKQYLSKQKNMIIYMKINSQSRKLQCNNFLKGRKQIINHMKLYDDDHLHHPFIMIDNYQKNFKTNKQTEKSSSLVVFVHGYQGSDYDLQKAKNYLSLHSPHSTALMIKSIQDEIDQNIELLGTKVGNQIKQHIEASPIDYKRISLIGYSLGGVIAREAVKHLQQYESKMNLLITFASPHLGVSMPDNQLVKTGIWYLIHFQNVKNLKQLNCQKQININQQQQEFFLSKLSQSQQLRWFKKLVLVSSQQDNFVPHHSARITPQNKSQSIHLMAQNIINRVKRIQRVEVWFDVDHNINTFDKILGRRAHIQFLENRFFLDTFFRLYGSQF